MPRYRISLIPVNGQNPTTPDPKIVDTGDRIPRTGDRESVTFTGLVNAQNYDVVVERLGINEDVVVASATRQGRPSRFDIDWSDAFSGGVSVGWTDQRGGTNYRVEHWVSTDAIDAAPTGTLYVTFVNSQTTGSASVTGLDNTKTYRFRVSRQAAGNTNELRLSASTITRQPDAGFDAPVGYTADGPSAGFEGDTETKAQFVTDSLGQTGILISFKQAARKQFSVDFYSGAAVRSLTTYDEAAGSKTVFVAVNLPVFQDAGLTVKGAVVTILSNTGAPTSTVASVTYV
jgi:hypothetical protein